MGGWGSSKNGSTDPLEPNPISLADTETPGYSLFGELWYRIKEKNAVEGVLREKITEEDGIERPIYEAVTGSPWKWDVFLPGQLVFFKPASTIGTTAKSDS